MLSNTSSQNGNGFWINGRGVKRRARRQRSDFAAAVVTGERQLAPSRTQIAAAFDISRAVLRRALKRAAAA